MTIRFPTTTISTAAQLRMLFSSDTDLAAAARHKFFRLDEARYTTLALLVRLVRY